MSQKKSKIKLIAPPKGTKCHTNEDRICDPSCASFCNTMVLPQSVVFNKGSREYQYVQVEKPEIVPFCRSGNYCIRWDVPLRVIEVKDMKEEPGIN